MAKKGSPKKKKADREPDIQQLFYKSPVPLHKDQHAKSGLTPENENFLFSSKTNSVPLNVGEFVEACKYYPIVFSEEETPFPICVLGIKNNQNLFVDNNGAWKSDTYIPAYVRRYPFAFTGDNNNLVLCIDEGSKRFTSKVAKGDFAFFEKDGTHSNFTKNALEFCRQHHIDSLKTQEFCKELKAKNLFVTQNISIVVDKAQSPIIISGFKVIDEKALANLSKEILFEWNKSGLLFLVYQCLLSNSNWYKLVKMKQ